MDTQSGIAYCSDLLEVTLRFLTFLAATMMLLTMRGIFPWSTDRWNKL